MSSDYYRDALSAGRLEAVYRLASPRVERYLRAEIDYVLGRIGPRDDVLELGCGYGRVLPDLAPRARSVFGIDTSFESLAYGQARLGRLGNCHLAQMDASRLAFASGSFDCTICIQNGISAFHVDALELVRESLRVTKGGGRALFSSYSRSFWEERLRWFERQAEAGLIGEIDRERTKDGVIVCRDGFTATTFDEDRFERLARRLGVAARTVEVDSSSIFCEIAVPQGPLDPLRASEVAP
jgi:SAM-dependent methyltransferase